MRKYSSKDIEKIILEVRNCILLYCTVDGKINCLSAEEFINYLSEYAKYVIPEKRQEWCDLIRAIIYNVKAVKPCDLSPEIENLIKMSDEKIINELFYFIWVAEIMEAYDECHNINDAVKQLEKQGHSGWSQSGVLHEVLRFSMFGPEFVNAIDPNRIKRNKGFKHEYLETKEYFEMRKCLLQRFVNVINPNKKVSLDEYKEYLINKLAYPCDNDEERINSRRERLANISDEYLQEIIDNTYAYAKYLLRRMKEENHVVSDTVFTSIRVNEDYDSSSINLGLTGGYLSDAIFELPCNSESLLVSEYLLTVVLKKVFIERDSDIYHVEDGDIGCDYEYPKLTFTMKVNDFNLNFSELIENRSLRKE